jgi:predicted HTH transcriptional regulator
LVVPEGSEPSSLAEEFRLPEFIALKSQILTRHLRQNKFRSQSAHWNVALDQITKDHIHDLFGRGVEEGENIDYKQSGCPSSKADIVELLKDFAAMANATGGIIIVGIRESDGRPILPLRAGLQNIPKLDKEINRLHQMISTRLEEGASNVKIRSIEVLAKRLLLIKVFHSVEPVGGKKTSTGHIEYPVRSGRITIWKRLKSTDEQP